MSKRKRRTYTDEFKIEAVKLVTEQGYSLAAARKPTFAAKRELSKSSQE